MTKTRNRSISKLYPSVVIAGTVKSGTTAVFHYLNAHPEVLGASRKEVQYFMDRDSSVFHPELNYLDHGIEGYQDFFKKHKNNRLKAVIEATPGYIYQKTALKAFSSEEALKDTKIVFILREPVSRLVSVFDYYRNTRLEIPLEIKFDQFIEMVRSGNCPSYWNEFLKNAIHHGQYIEYLTKWVESCGRERIEVLFYEQLKEDNLSFMIAVCKLLNIDTNFYQDYEFIKQNPTLSVKSPILHKGILRIKNLLPDSKLKSFFKEIYRKANFEQKQKTLYHPKLKDDLHAHYKKYNKRLVEYLNLDEDIWNQS